MNFNKARIIREYDMSVQATRQFGVSSRKVAEELADLYVGEWAGTTVSGLNVEELIRDSVRFHVSSTRASRKQSLRGVFEALGDLMDYPEHSDEHDKAKRRIINNWGRAFPLGVEEGTDKTLSMWSPDDVVAAVEARRENAQRQVASYNLFKTQADRAIRAMESGRVRKVAA